MRLDWKRFLAVGAAAAIWAAAVLAAGPAEKTIHLTSGGHERTCLVHEPAGLSMSRTPLPLLFVLHGGGGTAEGMVRLTKGRFDELADRGRFLVAYPEGYGKSWNDGRRDIRSKAREADIDDVAFFRELIAELSRRYPIDARRIFAAGMSNGAMMSLRLGCSLAGTMRAVAADAGSLPEDIRNLCPTTNSTSLLLIDGTEDPIVPYGGGTVRLLFSSRGEVIGAERTARLWAKGAGCRLTPSEESLPTKVSDGTSVTRLEYPGCRAGTRVVLDRVNGGGHAWPGGVPYMGEWLIGKTSANLSASDEIWGFFAGLK